MTRRLAVFFLVACFAFAADPETEVRAAVQKYVDIRDHPDPQALEALFTADADQLVSSGEWRKGREAMVKEPSPLRRKRLASGRLRLSRFDF